MIFLTPLVSSFVLTVWLSFLTLRFVPKWLIDMPVGRKSHKEAVPQSGGMVFGLVILLNLGLFIGFKELWWYLGGGILIYLLGLLDDYRTIPWQAKLVVQLLVASVIVYRFISEVVAVSFFNAHLNFSTPGLVLIFLIWFVGIINAVNLIDGMDGLAGGFMALISLFSVVIGFLNNAWSFMVVNAIILGAMVGFLFYNQKPAKIFMGDSGSLVLGYHVACLPLIFHQSISGGSVLEITPFLILASFLIMDTSRVFFSRILKKQNPMTADTIHLHHLMFQATNSYMGTLVPIFLVTWFTGVGSVLYYRYSYGFFAMQLFLLILILFVFVPPVPFYVPVFSRFIRRLSTNQIQRSSPKHLLRIRFLPFFALMYLATLITEKLDSGLVANLNIYHVGGLASLAIFPFLRRRERLSYQVLVTVFVLVQGILLLDGETPNNQKILDFLGLGSLAFLGMITISNYVQNSDEFGLQFWSVIDLLVLLAFLCLGIMSLNGIDVSLFTFAQLVIVYYAGILYFQTKLKSINSSGDSVGTIARVRDS